MTETNIKNERIKRKFFEWLIEANGCADATINNVEGAILHYEDFTIHADFATFNSDKLINIKKWLKKKEFRGKTISPTTYHTYLRYLRKFFKWLSWQSGYKSKVTPDIIDYLKISDKEERIATQSNPVKYPPLEHVIKLADSITIKSEIDLRDRALISFTLLSGMRVKAIVTLPLGCFDKDKLTINQDPKQGVETKFSKKISSILFKFDEKLFDYFMKWVDHLETNKGFCSHDPLFPRSKLEHCKDGLSFETATEVEPVYWQTSGIISKILKERSKEAGLDYFSPHTFRHLVVEFTL